MADIPKLIAENSARWSKAKIKPASADMFNRVARRLYLQKTRYQNITKSTGVPWWVIAVIHEREAGGDWTKSISQGDPWNRVSIHVPVGRGPFASFEAAAFDALANCAPHAAAWKDWSAGGTMTLLEQYNGLGYANKGIPSPYIWAGTDQYVKGKYISDGIFDPNRVDQQLGCAGLILSMMQLDQSIPLSKTTMIKRLLAYSQKEASDMGPNQEQILSLVRALLQIVGTMLVGNGIVHSSADWTAISGAVIMLVPIVWGMWAHTHDSALKVVEAMPEVKKIEVAPEDHSVVTAALNDSTRLKIVEAAPVVEKAVLKDDKPTTKTSQ